jgi:phytoene dehydrogenase-like protein
VVVGGGLAGLTAALYLARAGRLVTVFEKRRYLGGRAITTVREGFRFNLGAHAFYRAGAGAAVLRDLGIPVRGKVPKLKSVALLDGNSYRLPSSFASLLATGLLTVRGKGQFLAAIWRVRRLDPASVRGMTVRRWLDDHFTDERARSLMEAFVRLATYSDHADSAAADLALAQLKVALRGVLYVHEGWQRIIDAMHSAAISAGVQFVTSSRVVGVEHDGEVRAIELGGLELDADRMDTQSFALPEPQPEEVRGTRLPVSTVILAVDPFTAAGLVGDAGSEWSSSKPVTAACLDVALRNLPLRQPTFALGVDEPLYYSVHSEAAQIAPHGGALVHTIRYRREHDSAEPDDRRRIGTTFEEKRLEKLMDDLQPGWRDVLVHRRFLPAMTVSNRLVPPGQPRPEPVTAIRGLYIAGDWVGGTGLLSDASLASAQAAAKAVLAD